MTQPQQQEQVFDLDSIFDSTGGGDGSPSFAWPEQNRRPVIGSVVQGEVVNIFVTVVKDAATREPKLDKRGRQMPQVNLTLQTTLRNWEGCKNVPLNDPSDPNSGPKPASEDTGLRRIYVKFLMLEALAKAIKASSQQTGGPRIGARVAIRLSNLRPTSQMNPLPEYEAKYEPPAPTDAAWGEATKGLDAPAPAPSKTVQQDPWAAAAGSSEPPF